MTQRRAEEVNCSIRENKEAEQGKHGHSYGNSILGKSSEGNRVVSKSYEERVTYRTITKSEFQKRRASFENKEVKSESTLEIKRNYDPEKKVDGEEKHLEKSLLSKRKEDGDPYRIQIQEKEMTEKLKDIHRMISDMQELTRQLKGDKNDGRNKIVFPDRSITPRSLTSTSRDEAKTLSRFKPEPGLTPIRYRSTVLIDIASKWQRFREEVEVQLTP